LKALALARSNDRKNKFSNAYQFQTLSASVWNVTSDFFCIIYALYNCTILKLTKQQVYHATFL